MLTKLKSGLSAALLSFALALCLPLQAQLLTEQAVDAKVAELVSFIKGCQSPDGSFRYGPFPVGATALAALALRTAEVPANDPSLVLAASYLSRHASRETYEESLAICALDKLDPVAYSARIEAAAVALLSWQREAGGWGYGPNRPSFDVYMDESCSQYAVLGLASAEASGLQLRQEVKTNAKAYFYAAQGGDGGWGYRRSASTLSMTCAGLASLKLLGEDLEEPVQGCCGDYRANPAMERGLAWLSQKLRAFLSNVHKERYGYYALYGLERVAILNGLKEIAGLDWYRAGCANIIANSSWRADVVSASFALLFIARNSAPYAIGKWRWSGDSARHRRDAAAWAEMVSKRLKTPLDWQPVDFKAGPDAAMRCSMLFASGHGRFNASQQELAFLRQFLDAGGVLLGEACCGDKDFAESFKLLMEERLYIGKGMKFQQVSSSHPAMSCAYPLSPEEEPLLVLGKGCSRKQVFLLTRGVSCSLNGERKGSNVSDLDMKAASNLLIYSLMRHKPQSKFSAPAFAQPPPLDELNAKADAGDGSAFKFENPLGRVKFKGDWNCDSGAIPALRKSFASEPSLPAFDREIPIDPEKDDIFACQVLLLSGHDAPELSAKAILNLRRYLEAGGRLVAEACCSSKEFDAAFCRLAGAILPGRPLEPVPMDDPLWSQPFDLKSKAPSCSKAWLLQRGREWPGLKGVRDGSSWIVVYSPLDISCGLDGDLEDDIQGLKAESGAALWGNILSALIPSAPQLKPPQQEGGRP